MIGKNGPKISLGEFNPVPVDKYTVEIADVDLKTQKKFKSNDDEDVYNYKFAILDDKPMMDVDDDGEEVEVSTRGRFLWKRIRPALGERAWLRKLAEAAYGHKLSKEELKTFDPDNLVGRQVTVLLEHVEKEDKVYVNITSFNKVVEELPTIGDDTPKTEKKVVTKTTTSVKAPKAESVEDFTSAVDAEEAKAESTEAESDEEDQEILELQRQIAAKKAAKAKAEKK